MNQPIAKKSFRPASLRQPRSARTVLLRMAADQERADRIRALKQERPDLTWRRIADHVGVSERAASDWQKKGGIEYANAAKLAELFEVDVDYIWRGTETETPEPFAGSIEERLADLTEQLAADRQDRDDNITDVKALLNQQNALLARQSKILDGIENLLATQLSAARQMEDAATELRAATARRQSPQRTSPRSGSSKS